MRDFDGWYSRKGFPAFNMQAVVDDKKRFMSFSIRSGSQNDKNMFNKSKFGQSIHQKLPRHGVIIGDAGYTLYEHLMTPYPIESRMAHEEHHYNYLHSRTRIIVEQAFALLKNKFRIYKTKILWNNPFQIAEMITSTIILHNWMIDFGDQVSESVTSEEWMQIGIRYNQTDIVSGEPARTKRDLIKNYLYTIR